MRVDKNQSFLQVDTVIIDPEFSKYSKQQVCNIFTVSQKKVRNGVHFLHADKHKFQQVGIILIMVCKIDNIFAMYKEKSVTTTFGLYFYAKHSDI